MRFRLLIALLPLVVAFAGCRSITSCNAPPTQGSDESIPPLRIPTGLEAPDTRNALRIPELKEPERPRSKSERCLDEPPPFAAAKADAPAPAPAAEPKTEPSQGDSGKTDPPKQ